MDYESQAKQQTWAHQQQANIGQGISARPSPDPVSSSPIRDKISDSEELLSGLHGLIDDMEKRLDTCLSPVPPEPEAAGIRGNGPLRSHILGRLDILNDGFTHAGRRLQRLIGRIEI